MSGNHNNINKFPNKSAEGSDEGSENSGQAGKVEYHDFITPGDKDSIQSAMNDMRQALLGVAEVETDILKSIKDHLDRMLNQIYKQVREYQNIATMDAMLSDKPITKADPALVQGLDQISQNLNEKNLAISKLQHELENLGVGIFANSGQSAELLRQQLEELNKRNKLLVKIQREISKHPIITGKATKGVTLASIKTMVDGLNAQIQQLNKTNAELKAQIRQQKLQTRVENLDNKPSDEKPAPGLGRRLK